jgi:Flp pilus assembly protein TadB
MLILLHFLNPDYVNVLFTDIYGVLALVAAACMQIIGGLILWKIVNIEV